VDGSLYGTTEAGGNTDVLCDSGCGTIFSITPAGTLTTLYSFCAQTDCLDGAVPLAGVVQASDGNFYGTTLLGGRNGYGIVFKLTPSGALTVLYSFCTRTLCADGARPAAGLVEGADGNLYGTTSYGNGTVFKITLTGKLTKLYSFCSQTNCVDGAAPSGLVQGTDGDFYGTTGSGGANDVGGVFKITPAGTLTALYSFDSNDGAYPSAGVIQATNGRFYGTARSGGVYDCLYAPNICGTIYGLGVGLKPFVETNPVAANVGKPINILGSSLKGATSVTFNGTAATFTVVSPSLITTTVPAGATTGTVQVVTPGRTLSSNVPFRVVR
jgi:uncharacterized repeat protein (TIGR03803 family)